MLPAIIGGVSILSGLYSAYQQSEAQKRGEAYQEQQMAVMRQQQQFSHDQMLSEQAKYDQFQSLYGGIEENMANYYKNLSPEVYTSQMNDAITQQFESASVNLRENMAARGITGSGVEASAMGNLYGEKARAEAEAVAGADQWVAQQQQGFYAQQALPQQQMVNTNLQNAQTNYGGSFGSISNMVGNQASNQLALAGQYGQAAATGVAGGVSAIGNFYGSSSTQAQAQLPSRQGTMDGNVMTYQDGRTPLVIQ